MSFRIGLTVAEADLAHPSAAFRSSSGGICVDLGVHEFDQIRWLTGQEFVSIHAARTGDPIRIARRSWPSWTAAPR